VFFAFTTMGILCGAAAVLNAIRFNEVPGNPNNGLELQVIAAVVVGGASITGGRATLLGTLLGVTLLGILGTALTFLGVNPFWEKALQGGIILIAAASLLQRKAKHAAR
jgi:rhamnose transport system permease protein